MLIDRMDSKRQAIEEIKGATRNLFDCVLCAMDEGVSKEEITDTILQRIQEDAQTQIDLAKGEGYTIPPELWDMVANFFKPKRKTKKG